MPWNSRPKPRCSATTSLSTLFTLATMPTGQGDLAAAAVTYQKLQALSARGISMANIGLADLALYQGNEADAIALLEKGIAADIAAKDQSSAGIKSVALAQAYVSQGKKGKAVTAADQAITLNPDLSILLAAGDLYTNAGEPQRSAKLVTQLSSRIEPEPQIYSHFLRGSMALKRNQIKDAIEAFTSAQKISNTWLGHFYLGKAYLQNGSFTEAYSEFELCLKRRGEASAVFLDDVPTFRLLPPVYYYLGRAQEGLKSHGATDSFKTFLAIKEKGQGGDPLVQDA